MSGSPSSESPSEASNSEWNGSVSQMGAKSPEASICVSGETDDGEIRDLSWSDCITQLHACGRSMLKEVQRTCKILVEKKREEAEQKIAAENKNLVETNWPELCEFFDGKSIKGQGLEASQ